jgi:nitric oxide reductase NorD protein
MAERSASDVEVNDLERFGLLASALSGSALHVAPVETGEPAWTDGNTVFIDPGLDTHDRLQALAVQASLLAAGSLAPEVMRKLVRRPKLAKRYLAIEGHRALAANEDLLPLHVRRLIDYGLATRVDSPIASLAAARCREAIADPPTNFGTIHARKLKAAISATENDGTAGAHNPRRKSDRELAELADDQTDDGDDVHDIFSSPVGGGGAIGKLFQRMLGVVRKLGAGGTPGADSPTHRSRTGRQGGANTVYSAAMHEPVDDAAGDSDGIKYPEWDVHRQRYRPDWVTVQEVPAEFEDDTSVVLSDPYRLRRPLARLGTGLQHCHRQSQGDDIDIDAAVEARVEAIAGSAPDEAVYVDSLRRRRDLAVLVLLDVSGSAAEPGTVGFTVHEQQRAVAIALTVTLHDLGDRVSLYAFSSQGRSAVHLVPVKRFNDYLDGRVVRRLGGLVPGAYSRLGAAIRHGAAVLEERGGTPQRLLVVLSDGLAYDHGYERGYGAADARRALAEARRRGTGCLCLTIGAGTDDDDLQRVFGSAAHATIPRPEQLSQIIGPLFRSALQSAEVRRRVSQRKSLIAQAGKGSDA